MYVQHYASVGPKNVMQFKLSFTLTKNKLSKCLVVSTEAEHRQRSSFTGTYLPTAIYTDVQQKAELSYYGSLLKTYICFSFPVLLLE